MSFIKLVERQALFASLANKPPRKQYGNVRVYITNPATGLHTVVGLFTSLEYSLTPPEVPLTSLFYRITGDWIR